MSQQERRKKGRRARRISVALLGVIDILVLPHILNLAIFFLENRATALERWKDYSFITSIKDLFGNPTLLRLFMIMQLLFVGVAIRILWNVNTLKKNRVSEGVGGPDAAGSGQHGTSRWQTDEEKNTTVKVWSTDKELKKGGIIYGMEEQDKGTHKMWVEDDDKHIKIIGATRSGKSRKLILPSIWEIAKSGESMILGDPKGELYIYSKEYLEKQGYKVIALNLREPNKGNQWNILDGVNKAVDEGDIPKATELAWDIANTIVNQNPSTGGEPLWKNGEESTIAALILLAAMESEFKFQRHMATAYYLLAEYGQPLADETVPLMEYLKTLPVQHPAKSAFATATIAPYKTRASFFTTALSDLRLFSDPNIADMTSKQDHVLEDIGKEKTAVFLIVPDEKTTRNVLATLYIDQVYQSLVDLANKCGGRIPKRVNFIIDEFGNLPPIPNFDKKLTVAGGRGVRFTIAIQGIQQIKSLYEKSYQTISGNCHTWIYVKTADEDTAKLISEKTGKYTVATETAGASVQGKGHSVSQSEGLTGRALLMPDEVTRWDSNQSLILQTGQFPARYPIPDLSKHKANKDFGFVATEDIDHDKKVNGEIIKKRWESILPRELEELSIWLPDLEYLNEQPEPKQRKESYQEETIEEEDFL